MAKNNKHWQQMMSSPSDVNAVNDGKDPLEEGLENLSWLENSKRIVKKNWNKTRETFGEEVGNSITSGVLAIYILLLIPFAVVKTYINSFSLNNNPFNSVNFQVDLDVFAISTFLITAFLASLFTTIYHCMKHGTAQKRIFHKLDHIMCYFAVWGVFAPVCLTIVKGALGYTIFAIEFALALIGMFFMIFGYPNNKGLTRAAISIYGIMVIVGIPLIKSIFTSVSTACFWLFFSGVIAYVIGLFFYSGKKFKFSHMVWHIIVVLATVCHIMAFVYFLF